MPGIAAVGIAGVVEARAHWENGALTAADLKAGGKGHELVH